jgi:Flp pilus assembly protein TadD
VAQGRYKEAVTQFREAVRRDPLVVDPAAGTAAMVRGTEALRAGNFDAAIEHLRAAVEETPMSSEAHRILGAALRAKGDIAAGVERLREAVRLAPADERARVTLGRALAEAGRQDEAERALRETLEKLPASAETHWALADLYEQNDRGLEAVAELQRAAAMTVLAGKGALYFRLADLAHRHQDYELVASALGSRARLMPNEPGAHKDLGLAYARLGRQNLALVELVTTALLGLEDAETLAAIGQIHLEAGRFADAEEILRRAVARQPDLPQARYALGTALVRLGRAEEGKEHLAEFQRLRLQALEDQRRVFERGR